MFDSVYVFAKGLSAMDSGHSIKPTSLSCDVERPWDDGLSLYNYINAVVSGKIIKITIVFNVKSFKSFFVRIFTAIGSC